MLAMVVSLYMQHPAKYALLALLFSALFFMRYVGPVFAAPIAAIGVLADNKTRGWLKALAGNAAALIVSFAPMYWWLLRNHRIDGTYIGARIPGGGTFAQALLNGFATIGTFFSGQPFDSVVYNSWSSYPLAAQIAAVVLIIAVAASVAPQRRTPSLTAAMATLVVGSYLVFSAYRFVHLELGRLDTRMMVPLLAPMVVVVAILLDRAATRRTLSISALTLAALFLALNSVIFARDTVQFATESRHSSTTDNKNIPLYQFVRTLPDTNGLFSNAPQQLAPFVDAWPIFTQFQMDTPRPVSCTHRYAVWFKQFMVQDNIPDMTPVLYDDAMGTVYDLGPCSTDINTIWD
jgi:hypothetical protein